MIGGLNRGYQDNTVSLNPNWSPEALESLVVAFAEIKRLQYRCNMLIDYSDQRSQEDVAKCNIAQTIWESGQRFEAHRERFNRIVIPLQTKLATALEELPRTCCCCQEGSASYKRKLAEAKAIAQACIECRQHADEHVRKMDSTSLYAHHSAEQLIAMGVLMPHGVARPSYAGPEPVPEKACTESPDHTDEQRVASASSSDSDDFSCHDANGNDCTEHIPKKRKNDHSVT